MLAENYGLAFLLYFSVLNFLLLLQIQRFLAFPSTTVNCPLNFVEGALVRSCEDLSSVSRGNIWYIGSVSKPLELSAFSSLIVTFWGVSFYPLFSLSVSFLVYLHHGGFFLSSFMFIRFLLWWIFSSSKWSSSVSTYFAVTSVWPQIWFCQLFPEVQTNLSILGFFCHWSSVWWNCIKPSFQACSTASFVVVCEKLKHLSLTAVTSVLHVHGVYM